MPAAEPLVVWDVGLGAAANAMATIHAVEAMPAELRQRKLLIDGFENDLDSLKLALRTGGSSIYDVYFPARLIAGIAGNAATARSNGCCSRRLRRT